LAQRNGEIRPNLKTSMANPSVSPGLAVSDLLSYLSISPSPYHAVAAAATRLQAAGFQELDAHLPWSRTDMTGCGYVVRGGALLAWDASGDVDPIAKGFRIVGAHTDSPNLRVKPNPDVTSAGYRQLGVEVYGGILSNSWLDRDLGLSGRLVLRDGSVVLVNVERPLARVTQLAIHLDREVNDKGLLLDKQLHLSPIIGLGSMSDGDLRTFVAKAAGVKSKDVVTYDLMLHDLNAPTLLGLDEEFIVSARIDNLFSAWAATTALAAGSSVSAKKKPSKIRGRGAIPVIALFDHEEVGSESTTGAAGPMLERVLERIIAAFDASVEGRARALGASSCVSADMAHAVHPNYVERHEPGHRPLPNGGPVLKVNANQRYATDAVTAALFAGACSAADVPMQTFVSRNNQPCGSTIGPITATRLGIDTVDVGCAMLSMHSAREMCGASDASYFLRALQSYLR
jgi:aspartyl aminopeptidase